MVSGHFPDSIDIPVPIPVYLFQRRDIVFFKHFHEFDKDLCGSSCVIHSPVVILKRDIKGFRHDIQFVFRQSRQQYTVST